MGKLNSPAYGQSLCGEDSGENYGGAGGRKRDELRWGEKMESDMVAAAGEKCKEMVK